ncbi:MAG TPA: hypothetical protein VFX12_10945 [Vicinamibacterales bacterium]|nr:hypothetical protein [Vicinamibacterales bacterium]
MTQAFEDRRRSQDRRHFPRGGRRPGDRPGYAPLVLVADDDAHGERCAAILAALHFAVAPAHSVEEAMKVMEALRPELVVAHLEDGDRLSAAMRADAFTAGVPIIHVTEQTDTPEALVGEIRRVIRQHGLHRLD